MLSDSEHDSRQGTGEMNGFITGFASGHVTRFPPPVPQQPGPRSTVAASEDCRSEAVFDEGLGDGKHDRGLARPPHYQIPHRNDGDLKMIWLPRSSVEGAVIESGTGTVDP